MIVKITHLLAQSNNKCIGLNNTIPWKCKADMRHFAAYTKGKVLIMGRKTFDSIQPPLKGRTVIVVSRNPEYHKVLAELPSYHHELTIDDAIKQAKIYADICKEVVIVGGAEIYKATLPYCTNAVISEIDTHVDGDTFVDWEYNQDSDDVGIQYFEFAPDQ